MNPYQSTRVTLIYRPWEQVDPEDPKLTPIPEPRDHYRREWVPFTARESAFSPLPRIDVLSQVTATTHAQVFVRKEYRLSTSDTRVSVFLPQGQDVELRDALERYFVPRTMLSFDPTRAFREAWAVACETAGNPVIFPMAAWLFEERTGWTVFACHSRWVFPPDVARALRARLLLGERDLTLRLAPVGGDTFARHLPGMRWLRRKLARYNTKGRRGAKAVTRHDARVRYWEADRQSFGIVHAYRRDGSYCSVEGMPIQHGDGR